VLEDEGGRLAALAGLAEALVMDHADLLEAHCTFRGIIWVHQVQATPVGGFGGVQVADGGDLHVGVAEIDVGGDFGGGVAGALVAANGILIRRHAVGAALLAQDVTQGLE
jgi:hypothetical protein